MQWFNAFLRRGKRVHAGSDAPAASVRDDAEPPPDAGRSLSLREGTPEFDRFIAAGTLTLGKNLPHGAGHLASLLQVDPTCRDARDLAERYVAAVGPAVDELIPDVEPRYAATEALRAYFWQRQGRLEEAVARLIDVTKALGHAAYLHAWVLEWLEAEGQAETLEERTALLLFGTVLTHSEEADVAPAATLSALGRWSRLFERLAPRYTPGGLLTMIRAGLLRKAGRLDEALALAGPLEKVREFNHAVAIGLALRAKGDYEASARAFEYGIGLEPETIAGYLEAGDSYFRAGRWQAALDHYQSALVLQPEHDWAGPSVWFCRWKLEDDASWMDRLLQASTDGNSRAHALVFSVYGALKESGDASANVLRQVVDAWDDGSLPTEKSDGGIKITLSTLEAPSNRLAFALELQARGRGDALTVAVESLPAIDPRLPLAEVRYPVWRYDGVEPSPALAAPSPAVSAAIRELAQKPYDPYVDWAHAGRVAAALGPGAVEDVLAVTVHPPALPGTTRALAWLPRVQLAAASVAAQLDRGWEGSVRREALLSLLYGPRDWTTCAAVRALAWIAREEPVHAMAIHEAFGRLEDAVSDEGHWDWIGVLYTEWQTLPYLFDREREEFQRKLEAWRT